MNAIYESRFTDHASLLCLVRLRRLGRLRGKRLRLLKFGLKPVREIAWAVFKKNDEAEREKDEKREPENPAEERHGDDRNLARARGQ